MDSDTHRGAMHAQFFSECIRPGCPLEVDAFRGFIFPRAGFYFYVVVHPGVAGFPIYIKVLALDPSIFECKKNVPAGINF